MIFGSFNIFFNEICQAEGNEIYVDVNYHGIRDGTAEKPYSSIQYAIDMAEEGDTIYVFGGLYEDLVDPDRFAGLLIVLFLFSLVFGRL